MGKGQDHLIYKRTVKKREYTNILQQGRTTFSSLACKLIQVMRLTENLILIKVFFFKGSPFLNCN